MDGSKADSVKASEYISDLGIKTDIAEEKVAVEEEILESIIVDVVEDEDKGAEVVEYALQFVGNPYAWGCDSLTEGTDSSGFTKSVYEYFGISLEHDIGAILEFQMKAQVAGTVGIIGGADGPTSIMITGVTRIGSVVTEVVVGVLLIVTGIWGLRKNKK